MFLPVSELWKEKERMVISFKVHVQYMDLLCLHLLKDFLGPSFDWLLCRWKKTLMNYIFSCKHKQNKETCTLNQVKLSVYCLLFTALTITTKHCTFVK